MTTANNTQDLLVVIQQAQSANPLLADTQDFLVVLVQGRTQAGPPAFFNLQKLILTVKEATVPVRGRNQ